MKYTEGDVKVNGISVHYYRTGGAKPPLALLHGATDNGLCWTPTAERLGAGHGGITTGAPGARHAGGFGPAKPAGGAGGLLKQLGVTKPVIMGHSMGAGTTVNIAVNYPDVPRAIVLEDPGWRMPAPGGGQTAEERQMHEGVREMMASYASQTEAEGLARGRKENPKGSERGRKPG